MTKLIKYIFSVLPKNKISEMAGKITSSRISKKFVLPFSKKYEINLEEAEKPIEEYHTLKDFFTRRLKEGARPIDFADNILVSPVDGVVSQFGKIENDKLIQAKGIDYSIEDLIGKEQSKSFQNGHFAVIYLSPSDYHRIHMPVNGKISGYEYLPGRLYPVNQIGVNHVHGLFTKNERLTTYFDTNGKSAALVKVGAFIVGSIKISYQENVHHLHRGNPYQGVLPNVIDMGKGEEIGWFEFGSTVILLFEEDSIQFNESMKFGKLLKMGEPIAKLL